MPWRGSEAQKEYNKKYRREHPEAYRANSRRFAQKRRMEVLAAYGSVCQCCGEHREPFLCLDHINGGGQKHRRTVSGGSTLYVRLAREGFPPGFQVLCANCNMAKERPGGCPHQLAPDQPENKNDDSENQ